jgi:hypothetical protein
MRGSRNEGFANNFVLVFQLTSQTRGFCVRTCRGCLIKQRRRRFSEKGLGILSLKPRNMIVSQRGKLNANRANKFDTIRLVGLNRPGVM